VPYPEEDLYGSKAEAEAKAKEIGCVGSHTHEVDGEVFYMPCEKMEDYENVTGKKHASDEDYTLVERQESEPAPKKDQIQGSKKMSRVLRQASPIKLNFLRLLKSQ